MKSLLMVFAFVSAAISAIVFTLFLWFFADLANWPTKVGLPPISLTQALCGAALAGGLLGLAHAATGVVSRGKRTVANREFSARLQLDFEEQARPLNWPAALVSAVHEGEAREFRQHTRGEFGGLPFDMLDIEYAVRSTDSEGHSSTTIREHTVCVWELANTALPRSSIRPRNWHTEVSVAFLNAGALLGFDANAVSGSDCVTVREFNRRFVVIGERDDEEIARVRRLCVPRVMQGLLDLGRRQLATCDSHVALWRPGRCVAGLDREQLMRQSHVLVQSLLRAQNDPHARIVPDDPRAVAKAKWVLLPAGCAVASAVVSFFLGGIGAFGWFLSREHGPRGELFWLLPVGAFGFLAVGAGLGWLAGTMLLRVVGARDD